MNVDISQFGDIVYGYPSHSPVFGEKSGMPLYGATLTDLDVMTEWVFSQKNLTENRVDAVINGQTVCRDHVTGHIGDYNIYKLGSNAEWSEELGGFVFYFTMSLTPVFGDLPISGECVFKCWSKEDPNAACEQLGLVTDTKTFRLIWNIYKPIGAGRVVIEPA